MADIELIPADYAATPRLAPAPAPARRSGCVLLALATAAARAWLGWRIAAERPAVAALRQAETRANARRTALDARCMPTSATPKHGSRALQALRDRAAWPLRLPRHRRGAPPEPLVRRARLPARGTRGPRPAPPRRHRQPPAPAASAAAAPPPLLHRFEIVGHALTHAAVTDFMRDLGAQPGIANLRLTDSGMRRYSTIDVVDFRLTGLLEPDRSPPDECILLQRFAALDPRLARLIVGRDLLHRRVPDLGRAARAAGRAADARGDHAAAASSSPADDRAIAAELERLTRELEVIERRIAEAGIGGSRRRCACAAADDHARCQRQSATASASVRCARRSQRPLAGFDEIGYGVEARGDYRALFELAARGCARGRSADRRRADAQVGRRRPARRADVCAWRYRTASGSRASDDPIDRRRNHAQRAAAGGRQLPPGCWSVSARGGTGARASRCRARPAPRPVSPTAARPGSAPSCAMRRPGAKAALPKHRRPGSPSCAASCSPAPHSIANVDGTIVSLGEAIDGWRLLRVEDGRALFAKAGAGRPPSP